MNVFTDVASRIGDFQVLEEAEWRWNDVFLGNSQESFSFSLNSCDIDLLHGLASSLNLNLIACSNINEHFNISLSLFKDFSELFVLVKSSLACFYSPLFAVSVIFELDLSGGFSQFS